MIVSKNVVAYNRASVAHVLVEKLRHLADAEPVIVATSLGGAIIGKHLSSCFHTPLELVICRKLNHPSRKNKSIGSVCESGAVINNTDGIPQDFIAHQIILHQHACRFERAQYARPIQKNKITNQTIIVAVDEIIDINSVLAAIEFLNQQKPLRIIVVAGFLSNAVSKMLDAIVDEVVYFEILNVSDKHAFAKITEEEKEIVKKIHASCSL